MRHGNVREIKESSGASMRGRVDRVRTERVSRDPDVEKGRHRSCKESCWSTSASFSNEMERSRRLEKHWRRSGFPISTREDVFSSLSHTISLVNVTGDKSHLEWSNGSYLAYGNEIGRPGSGMERRRKQRRA